jgi:hypothetical protein
VCAPAPEGEYDSLGVAALDDPVAARQLNWAVEDLPAGSLYAPRRGIYVADVKVVKPEGSGTTGALVTIPPNA